MNRHHKVQAPHLERQAFVYIRQSSLRQVEQHLESQDLQYQLIHRAQMLGWTEEQTVVIDDDLGKSAATATDRHGFQELVAAVGLGRVGIILVTDVSRLARNCSDWYQLLDLASVYGTLISDASGVYDPRIYDDEGDLLLADRVPDRVILLPSGDPRDPGKGRERIRIQWGQHLLADLLTRHYRTLICGVNVVDNSHGIIGEIAEMLPTSQWNGSS